MFVGGVNSKSAIPVGNLAPSAWVLPQKAGSLSSRQLQAISVTGSATGVRGLPGEGASEFSITTNNPEGQLIMSGAGTTEFSITTNNPLLVASANGAGGAEFSFTTNTPILGAVANLTGTAGVSVTASSSAQYPEDDSSPLRTGSATFSITGTLTRYAVGHMEGSALPYTELSPQSLASAVWDSILADYQQTGSAGKALSTASSGGVDLVAMAQAILDAAEVTPIHSNTKQINSATVIGTGQQGDDWRGEGVQPN
jgi:hypothetical protein